MTNAAPDSDELLARTANGDRAARDQLIIRHRARLRKMVAYHLGRRMRARVDPSDVVQEVLAEASRKLPDYLRQRPLPFYP
jgi:RNA polymerase sigma-70 factor (ECF subfamily)